MTKSTTLLVVGLCLATTGVLPVESTASADGTDANVDAARGGPTAKVSVRSGKEPVEMQVRQGSENFKTVVGSFDARLSSRGRQHSGRIRMEWGLAERDRGTGVMVDVRVRHVSVSSAGVVTFSGLGTRTDRATGRVVEFPVTGSAQRDPAAPDCVIFDIIGGSVHDGVVEFPGRFDIEL